MWPILRQITLITSTNDTKHLDNLSHNELDLTHLNIKHMTFSGLNGKLLDHKLVHSP
jgi:hypothetical protein